MSGPEFFQTHMGQRFFEHTMPSLVRQIEKLNEQLAKTAHPLEEAAKLKAPLEKRLEKSEAEVLRLELALDDAGSALASVSLARNDNTAPAYVVLEGVGKRAHEAAERARAALAGGPGLELLNLLDAVLREHDGSAPIGGTALERALDALAAARKRGE